MGNRNPEVDTWLQQYDNAHRELVGQIREFVLSVDPRLSEAIKWQAPTFIYKGNIASFFPRSKRHPDVPPRRVDRRRTGPARGDGEVSRVARFVDSADFEAKKPALEAVILGWIREKG